MKELSLRELQLEEAKILEKTVSFLEENNLRYFLYAGTLIGAVRHQGFIPWDDDIDIAMPRPDYEKFLALTKKDRSLPNCPNYRVESMEYTNLKYTLCKVTDPDIAIDSDSKEDKNLWIDILPLDGLPENMRKANKILVGQQHRRTIIHIKFTPIRKILKERRSLPNRLAKIVLKPVLALYPTTKLLKKMASDAQSYSFENSFFCGAHAWETNNMPVRLRKNIFDDFVLVDFEGKKYRAPAKYDEYLSYMYGDYMKLPPKDQRVTHGTKAYKINH